MRLPFTQTSVEFYFERIRAPRGPWARTWSGEGSAGKFLWLEFCVFGRLLSVRLGRPPAKQ